MGYWGTSCDYRAGADADNLTALERELGVPHVRAADAATWETDYATEPEP